MKITEMEKKNKYLDLTKELKKLLNMRVTVIPIVVGVLEMVPEDLERRLKERYIRERIQTIKITSFFRMARILR